MANLIILAPATISALSASRGSGALNLLTADPKEVWADTGAAGSVSIDVDLGGLQPVDTIYLGSLYGAASAASWTISGGAAGYVETVIKPAGPLRVPDVAGRAAAVSHALWHGASRVVRYIRISITIPAGAPQLMVGVLMVGAAFRPSWNKEWGSGRRPIDTGTATALPSGGFGIGEGVRKAAYYWTLGDLAGEEVDRLYDLAIDRGETRTVLVVEDPDQTVGLRNRIHYGLFERFRQYERRNRMQTRWEFGLEQWV